MSEIAPRFRRISTDYEPLRDITHGARANGRSRRAGDTAQMDELEPFLALGLARERRAPPRPADWELRELNHRLANSLQLAVDLLGLQRQATADPGASRALEEAMARLAAVGQLHRHLSLQDADGPVELAAFLRGLCAMVGLSTGLVCELAAEPASVPAAMAQHVGLLINECAINARKHAYGHEGGVLRIAASVSPGRLRLTVADEGRGLPAEGVAAQGLGMSIIGAIVRELRGTLSVESRGGARFSFLVPLASAVPSPSRSFAAWNEA
jgi:two-component sensor histidine kinase